MTDVWTEVVNYLREVDGTIHTLREWPDGAGLAAYLRANREFRTTELAGQHVLLVATADVGAQQLKKLAVALADTWGAPVAFVLPPLHPQTRARLIDADIAFMAPGAFLYFPQLYVSHRSRARVAPASVTSGQPLTPAAQATLIYLLNRTDVHALAVTEIATSLGFTKMTISRAVTQLSKLRLTKDLKIGKRRDVGLAGAPGEIWSRALPFLRSPIHRTVWVAGDSPASEGVLEAGDTAVSRYSELAPPRVPQYAVSRRKDLNALDWVESRIDAGHQLQVWLYDPAPLAEGETVDRLSLYLSLRHDPDERLQMALEQMMGVMGWLKD